MKTTRKLFLLTITLTALLLTACGKDTVSVETATSVPDVSVETPAPEPVHEHDIVTVANGDGTHTVKCADSDGARCSTSDDETSEVLSSAVSDGLSCDYTETTEPCTFDENYICTVCEFQHVHELSLATDSDGARYSTSDDETSEVLSSAVSDVSINELNKQHMYECIVDGCDYKEIIDCTLDEDTWICTECGTNWAYTVEPIESAVKYATVNLNVRSIPNKSGDLMKELKVNDEVTVTGKVSSFKDEDCEFYQLDDGNFADGHYLSDEKVTVSTGGGNGNKPATAPNGNVLDWSKPNPYFSNTPYSEDGYVLMQVIDNGGDDICIYNQSFDTGDFNAAVFGQLQKQADDLWYSRGHSSHAWHMVMLPNGVWKWYLTD